MDVGCRFSKFALTKIAKQSAECSLTVPKSHDFCEFVFFFGQCYIWGWRVCSTKLARNVIVSEFRFFHEKRCDNFPNMLGHTCVVTENPIKMSLQKAKFTNELLQAREQQNEVVLSFFRVSCLTSRNPETGPTLI